MPFPPTPNMNLALPIPGVDLGPAWATLVNDAFRKVDTHDHTDGNGVPLNANSITFTSDLNVLNNGFINVNSIGFTNNTVAYPASAKQRFIYVAAGELFYNDSSNRQIQLTLNGVVNSSAGVITGLGSNVSGVTSSGSYNADPTVLAVIFKSNVVNNIAANMDVASVILRNLTSNSHSYRLDPPANMSADYIISLPIPPSTATSLLNMTTTGAVGTITYDLLASSIGPTGANAIAVSMTSAGADSIGQKMTLTGANAIGVAMNSTGADAVGQDMTSVGADSIGTRMSTTGANAIGLNLTTANFFLKSGSNFVVTGQATSGVTRGLGIVRGIFNPNGTIITGEGFTVTPTGAGTATVSFANAGVGQWTVTANAFSSGPFIVSIITAGAGGFNVQVVNIQGTLANTPITFIAIGPR